MKKIGVALVLAAIAYAGYDLWGPAHHDLREFDPDQMARVENDMWRSYYQHRRADLVLQLARMLRSQYGAPFLRSFVLAGEAGRAAIMFQRGRSRADYEQALPLLETYYNGIRRISVTPFDPRRAARLELEWWIAHRERGSRPREDLERALAEWQSEMCRLPAEAFAEHAHWRAEAMLLRDRLAQSGTVSEEGWSTIGGMLRTSWESAWKRLHTGTGA